MKSKSKSKFALLGFVVWLTAFSAIVLTPAASLEQNLITVEDRVLQPGKTGRYRYYSGYLGLSDHKITVEATADAEIYVLLLDALQQNESNQDTYYNMTNYITAPDGGSSLYTDRWFDDTFDLSWRELSDERMYIIFQNEQEFAVTVSFTINKAELSTLATYFGIGAAVLLTAIFFGLLSSKKKLGTSGEETPAPAA